MIYAPALTLSLVVILLIIATETSRSTGADAAFTYLGVVLSHFAAAFALPLSLFYQSVLFAKSTHSHTPENH